MTVGRLCLSVVHDCVVGWLSLASCTVHTVLRLRVMFIRRRRIGRVGLAVCAGKNCLHGLGRNI